MIVYVVKRHLMKNKVLSELKLFLWPFAGKVLKSRRVSE